MDDKRPKDGSSKSKGTPTPKRPKSTQAEADQRVKELIRLQLEGYCRPDLLEFIRTQWGLQRAQADNLIKLATERIKEINNVTIQDNMALIVSNYWEQFRKANKANNGQLCVTILEKIAKLKGLDQITVNHIVEDRRELENMSDEELDQLLESNEATH
ncbi:hypothetical protein ACES2J_08310 [Bdellovibrio bacteriovorus]|uniref:hypothetical protein n=1 Tax=Bdellovibrio bacteriovorus TaxID=959 RepID=UPI0035A6A67C